MPAPQHTRGVWGGAGSILAHQHPRQSSPGGDEHFTAALTSRTSPAAALWSSPWATPQGKGARPKGRDIGHLQDLQAANHSSSVSPLVAPFWSQGRFYPSPTNPAQLSGVCEAPCTATSPAQPGDSPQVCTSPTAPDQAGAWSLQGAGPGWASCSLLPSPSRHACGGPPAAWPVQEGAEHLSPAPGPPARGLATFPPSITCPEAVCSPPSPHPMPFPFTAQRIQPLWKLNPACSLIVLIKAHPGGNTVPCLQEVHPRGLPPEDFHGSQHRFFQPRGMQGQLLAAAPSSG